MEDPVGDLPSRKHLRGDELPDQGDVLVPAELDRQSDDEFLGELGVAAFLEGFDRIPKGLGGAGNGPVGHHVAGPFRSIGRQQELLVGEVLLVRIVDGARFRLVAHLRAMAIGGGQHGAAAISARNELRCEMRDRHGPSSS